MKESMTISNSIRKPAMILTDILLINISVFMAFLIRFDWHLTPALIRSCAHAMLWVSFIRIASFAFFGIYQWSFRHATLNEAVNIIKAMTISSLLLVSVAFFTEWVTIGRSVLLIDYLICLLLIGASRFSPRIMIKLMESHPDDLKRVLIVGAGATGVMIVRTLINVQDRIYQPIGFIDDDPMKKHARINGIKVLGSTDQIVELSRKYEIDEIIIAMPSASGQSMRNVISKCEKSGLKIKTLPSLHKILTGEVIMKEIREVEPIDLLGRGTVEISTDDINHYVRGKVILVTGASGSVGSELCRQIMRFKPSLLLLYDHCENDTCFLEIELKNRYPTLNFKTIIGGIRDASLLKETFSKYKPQIVFHSAAHKHVTLMERNPISAVKNNILGTKTLIDVADYYEVEKFVMISTDKAINPTSVMGASKHVAEMMIKARSRKAKTKFMSVRFGNVIGSSGSVVPIFKRQIEAGGPITVTHPEVKRYFMTATEAAQLVLQASAMGDGGEIFVLDMGEQIKIVDLARNLIVLSGLEPGKDIEIKFIGLRPGERIAEEDIIDAEHDRMTGHDKIYVTGSASYDPDRLTLDIQALEQFANNMDEANVIAKLKEMIPTYHSHTDLADGNYGEDIEIKNLFKE